MRTPTNRKVHLCLASSMLIFLALSGCATGPGGSSMSATSAQKQKAGVTFPEKTRAWLVDGTYPDVTAPRKMHAGLTKDQVYELLGRPHFHEGLFNIHEWNYIFHLPDGNGGYATCQYQVHFDHDMRTEAMYWKDQPCAQLIQPKPDKISRTPIRLSAATLFAFDSAKLKPQAQDKIASLAQRIRDQSATAPITVTGYTDRLGSDAYNQTLSQQRADAVRTSLIQHGIEAQRVHSVGAGSSHPVVHCDGRSESAAVKQCLQPNRRVEIKVDNESDTG